ncbi:hypothetical protein, partial [Bosea sp. (in: a-proteobacteria)]|uniref:hypothetical protein n=1 Tax=Bosea sp. (in: a-proteobacteria) TaxID=1871050 RepID=UPI0031FEECF4
MSTFRSFVSISSGLLLLSTSLQQPPRLETVWICVGIVVLLRAGPCHLVAGTIARPWAGRPRRFETICNGRPR